MSYKAFLIFGIVSLTQIFSVECRVQSCKVAQYIAPTASEKEEIKKNVTGFAENVTLYEVLQLWKKTEGDIIKECFKQREEKYNQTVIDVKYYTFESGDQLGKDLNEYYDPLTKKTREKINEFGNNIYDYMVKFRDAIEKKNRNEAEENFKTYKKVIDENFQDIYEILLNIYKEARQRVKSHVDKVDKIADSINKYTMGCRLECLEHVRIIKRCAKRIKNRKT